MFWPGRDYSDHGSWVLDSNNARRPSVGRMPRAPPPPARPRTRVLLFAKYTTCDVLLPIIICVLLTKSTDRSSWSLQDFSELFWLIESWKRCRPPTRRIGSYWNNDLFLHDRLDYENKLFHIKIILDTVVSKKASDNSLTQETNLW